MQVLAFLDHFGIADDDARVNPYGGAIAIGHPLASSGVRLMTQLARTSPRTRRSATALTAMCVGIGMGGTVIWENTSMGGHQVSHDDTGSAADGEVVTQAKVRYVDLPGGAGSAALITLDNGLDHTKPNTFGPGGLGSLDDALDEVESRRTSSRSP